MEGPQDTVVVQLLEEIKEELVLVVYEMRGMERARQPEYSLLLWEVEIELNGWICGRDLGLCVRI